MSLQSVRRIESEAMPHAMRVSRRPATQKRVLCATDLSPESQRAVARAAFLTKQLDAELMLLHVIDSAELTEQSIDPQNDIARQLASTAVVAHREPKILVRRGSHVETIAAVAKELDADVIVLGAHRRKALAPLIGATAERIVALAARPALIVHLDSHVRYGAVVIAAELSDAFIQVVQVASSLKFLDAETVTIVHGFESPYRGPLYAEGFDTRAAIRNMEAWERAAGAKLLLNLDVAGVESSRFRLVFQQAQPIRAIQRTIRSVRPELLIIGTKERSMFNRLARGSVANDVLRTVPCDILVAAPEVGAEIDRDSDTERSEASAQRFS